MREPRVHYLIPTRTDETPMLFTLILAGKPEFLLLICEIAQVAKVAVDLRDMTLLVKQEPSGRLLGVRREVDPYAGLRLEIRPPAVAFHYTTRRHSQL
jgi:hypothetical protein